MNPAAVNRIMAEGNLGLQTFWVPQVRPHVVPKAIQGCRSAAVSYLFAYPKKIVWKCVAKLLTKVHHRDHIHHGTAHQKPHMIWWVHTYHHIMADLPTSRLLGKHIFIMHFCQAKSYCELKLGERRGKVECLW